MLYVKLESGLFFTTIYHEKIITNVIINDWITSYQRIYDDLFNQFHIAGHTYCVQFFASYQYHWQTSLCINVFYMSHYFFRRDSTMEIIDAKSMAIGKPLDIIDSLLFPNVPTDIPPRGMPILLHSVTIWYLLILAELKWLSLPKQDYRISSSVSPRLSTSPKTDRVA